MRQQPSPSRGGFRRGVGNQDSPRRGTGSVNLTKIFAKGGFPPKQIKPRPFEKGRGLEKRLKPLLMKKGLGLMEKPSVKREKPLLKDKKGLGLLVKKSYEEGVGVDGEPAGGASVRQLQRLTGIDRGIIQRAR